MKQFKSPGFVRNLLKSSKPALPTAGTPPSESPIISGSSSNFPSELLLHIFDTFVAEIFAGAQLVFLNTATGDRQVTKLDRGQLYWPLLQSALVCKIWYLIAIEALCCHPIFIMGWHTCRFAEFLKKHPQCTRFVRSFSYVDTTSNNPYHLSAQAYQLLPVGFRDPKPESVDASITWILKTCGNITVLSLASRNSLTNLTMHGSYQNFPVMSLSQLRSLTLHQCRLVSGARDVIFQKLEYLCFRNAFSFHGRIDITPTTFPCLCDFAFVDFYRWNDIRTVIVQLQTIPTLRSLMLLNVSIPSGEPPLPYIPQLQRLCIIGVSPPQGSPWMTPSPLHASRGNLKHTTIGLYSPTMQDCLQNWTIPPTLESLTIYVNFESCRFECYLHNINPAEFILRFLEANTPEISSGSSFRTLVVHIVDPGVESIIQRSQLVESAMKEIERKCGWLGVSFEVLQSCEIVYIR